MIKHFMYVPFTGLGLHKGFRGDIWLKNRIAVFLQYVLPSLMNQTSQDFTVWISWRPEEKENPIVQQFKKTLDSIRDLDVVFTYGGVCFYDDKYPPIEAKNRLLKSLQLNLPDLEPYVKDCEWVYMTIQPSDDMYLSDSVERFQAIKAEKGVAMGFTEGYIINYANKQVAEYNPTTYPPFYTLIFPTEIFMNPFMHVIYTGPYPSHEYVKEKFRFAVLKGRGFVVGTHGSNISTTWDIPFKGRELTDEERDNVLIKTGVYFSKPIMRGRSGRLIARSILNRLPFSSIIRDMYHKLPEKLKLL